MNDSQYPVAEICQNGHVMSEAVNLDPSSHVARCTECGEPTTTTCKYCGASIRGRYPQSRGKYKRPHNCHACGQEYDWGGIAIA